MGAALGEIALSGQRGHSVAMKRATKRPKPFAKPVHWSNEPAPKPEAAKGEAEELSPTRYGDWVSKGIAVDF
jgi:hypothetical protein